MTRWTVLILFYVAVSAFGQTPTPSPSTTSTPELRNIWRCDLPGGTYEVTTRAMISVSRHEYIVDGVASVKEVNIDTQGNMAVRFYYIEPTTAKAPLGVGQAAIDRASDLAKEAAGRAGGAELWKRVIKSYPATTHAHTIEFRVESEEQLLKIFTSVQTAFESGRGETLKLAAD